jgi:chromosome segregation ATPase
MSERDRIRVDEESVKRQLESCKQQIRQLEDTRNQREQELTKRSRDTYCALQWLRTNQDRFKEAVIEPMMLVITVKDPSKAKFVEAAIPFRDMTAFVCQNTEDLHLFLQETHERQNLKINAVQPPPEELSQFKPKKPLSDLKRFGFQSYLLDLMEAPHAVLRYLCKTSFIHDIPVGNEQTDQNISDVADKSGLVRFFTPSSLCAVKVSRYGSHDKSTRISALRNPRFLDVQMDIERHSELQLRCQDLRANSQRHTDQDRKLKVKEEQLRKEENELRQQKKDLSTRKGMKRKLENDICTRRKMIEDSNANDAVDLKREECKMKMKIQEVNKERVRLAATWQTIMEECHELVLKRICLALRHAVLANECERCQTAQRDANWALSQMEERFEEAKRKTLQCKELAKQLLKKAQDKTGTKQLSAELKQAFEQYPETLDEIDAHIHEERARAECNQATNDEIVKKYEERQDHIDCLEGKVEAMGHQLQRDEEGLDKLKKRSTYLIKLMRLKFRCCLFSWLDPLKQRLDEVSKQYGLFFQEMGCASEVSLIEDEDYSKFGISLRVKYRKNEELHELTAHHQSGGERSVATILYLMALQGVTDCPFRLVDEINQGMDPNNERKVFELMVQTVSTLGSSQYFLFSPKLLPGLPFNESVTVCVVHNGPFMLPHCNWNVEKAMTARKKFDAED